jgi:HD-GYP domain-containing protein (c-di-GMP phosphodiesterase class II)
MKLAKKINSEEGLVLLAQGVELTSKLIVRLSQCGISYVYIEDHRTADIEIVEVIHEETRTRALAEIRTTFKGMMDSPNKKNGAPYPYVGKQFRNVMKMVIDDLSGHKDAMIMLMNMETVDHYLFQHSLNVCIYTTLLGMAYGYKEEELMALGLGALLHDIGKTQISTQVLLKPDSLSQQEFTEIKSHAERGFRLLKDEPNIPLLTAHCAYQHHERLDGSGYPRGLQGDEIHEYAKWIGVVDSYDAMTTTRVYRGAMLPHQAMEALYAGTGTLYEQRMVQLFRDKVAIYPIGIAVTLNTGERGIVMDINAAYPDRPIVRILYNEAGEELKIPFEIDLSKSLTTMVKRVNEDDNNRMVTVIG